MSLAPLITGMGTVPALVTLLFDQGGDDGGGGGDEGVEYKSWAWEMFEGAGDVRVTVQAQVGGERPIVRRFYTEGDVNSEVLFVPESASGGIYPIGEGASVRFVMKKDDAAEAAIDAVGSVTLFQDTGSTMRRALKFTFTADNPMPSAGRYRAYFVVDGTALPLGQFIPITVQEALN